MNNSILVTQENLDKLKADLEGLIKEKPEVIARIAWARSNGDLKENADYHAARERLGWIEGYILVLNDKIARSQIIDKNNMRTDKIIIGMKVVVEDSKTLEPETFHVVSEFDAGSTDEKISVASPIGKALLGKKVGDTVEIQVPRGVLGYKILEISIG